MKYGNKPCVVDGQKFHSQLEAKRYSELSLLQRAGKISQLQTQVAFALEVQGHKICKYIADFVYMESGTLVVEDTKSAATVTQAYTIKKKLMKALHGIDIVEVYARPRTKARRAKR